MRLSGNKIGNRGIQSLEFLFSSSETLEELDLSENCIGSKGAISVFGSLAKNKNGIPLSILNLAQNEIWEIGLELSHNGNLWDDVENANLCKKNVDRDHFLSTNNCLEELNLDGNFLNDEGAEQIAAAIMLNQRGILKNLYLDHQCLRYSFQKIQYYHQLYQTDIE